MSLVSELKAFLMRGNVVDLAVGVVIGAAFGKIVESVVKGIFTPIIGVLTGGVDFSKKSIDLIDTFGLPALKEGQKCELMYGSVITETINFIIIGTFLFFVIKAFNKMKAKEPEKPKETPEEIKLLTEIRDALRK